MDAEDLLLREFLGIRTDEQTDGGGALDPLAPARRRHLGELLRRAARPVDHHRGLRGPPAGRRLRPTRSTWRGARSSSAAPAGSSAAGSSPASGWRCSASGPGTSCRCCPPRSCFLPPWVPAQHLRLRLLGPPDAWSPSRSSAPTARSAPLARSASTSCGRGTARRRPRAAQHLGRALPRCSTASCTLRAPPGQFLRRRRPCAGAERWILQRQEADGSWGGIQPPWVYSLIALHLQRLRARPPGHARPGSPASTASRSRTRPDAGSRPASRPSGTPPSRSSPSPTPASAGRSRRSARRPAGCWARRSRCRATGPCGGPNLAAGRLGVRVRQRQLPRHRRHGRGRPRRSSATAEPTDGADRRGRSPGSRGCSAATAAGRAFDVDNTQDALPRAALLRLRRAHRPAERRRDRARRRDARRARAGAVAAVEPGVAWLLGAQEDDGSWFGRWGANSRLRHRRGRPGACRRRRRRRRPGASAGPSPGSRRIRTPTAAGARTCAPTTTPDRRGRGPSTASPDGLGAPGAARGGRASRRDRARRRLPRRHPARGRHAGTSRGSPGPGFPGDFYINYHLYRLVFPVMALGRYVNGRTATAELEVLTALRVEAFAVGGARRRHRRGPDRARRPVPSSPRGSTSGTAVALVGSPAASPRSCARATSSSRASCGRPSRRRARRSRRRRSSQRVRAAPASGADGAARLVAALRAAGESGEPGRLRRCGCRHGVGLASWAGSPTTRSPSVRVDLGHDGRRTGPAAESRPSAHCWRCARRSNVGRVRCGDREVVLASPRSFCAGVERAIEIVERALERYGAPVYVRRQIVHNLHVVARSRGQGRRFRRGARPGASRRHRGARRPRRLAGRTPPGRRASAI